VVRQHTEASLFNLLRQPPAGQGEAALVRTDPAVQALARYVLESALDVGVPARDRPARRSGVLRTSAVRRRTTVILVRLRFRLTLPVEDGVRQLVAEDTRVLAFEGAPHQADWLSDARAEELLTAQPSGNIVEGAAYAALDKIISGLPEIAPYLEEVADQHADRLLARTAGCGRDRGQLGGG
jgi:hypothetical protein